MWGSDLPNPTSFTEKSVEGGSRNEPALYTEEGRLRGRARSFKKTTRQCADGFIETCGHVHLCIYRVGGCARSLLIDRERMRGGFWLVCSPMGRVCMCSPRQPLMRLEWVRRGVDSVQCWGEGMRVSRERLWRVAQNHSEWCTGRNRKLRGESEYSDEGRGWPGQCGDGKWLILRLEREVVRDNDGETGVLVVVKL